MYSGPRAPGGGVPLGKPLLLAPASVSEGVAPSVFVAPVFMRLRLTPEESQAPAGEPCSAPFAPGGPSRTTSPV